MLVVRTEDVGHQAVDDCGRRRERATSIVAVGVGDKYKDKGGLRWALLARTSGQRDRVMVRREWLKLSRHASPRFKGSVLLLIVWAVDRVRDACVVGEWWMVDGGW